LTAEVISDAHDDLRRLSNAKPAVRSIVMLDGPTVAATLYDLVALMRWADNSKAIVPAAVT
jgi:hypothetical protein